MKTKKNNNNLSFILYEDKNIPVFFRLNKSVLRFLLAGLPLITLLSLATILFGASYFRNIQAFFVRQEPKMITSLKEESSELKKKIFELQEKNRNFEQRLSSTDVKEFELFGIFKKTPGQKDFSATPYFEIENITTKKENGDIAILFNLKNIAANDDKLSGFLFVFMQERSSVQYYPNINLPIPPDKLSFSSGESFATSRFRPVEAKFKHLDSTFEPVFTVVIFNRLGDLIHKQVLKP